MKEHKKIIMLTGNYPYGEGEAFVADEIGLVNSWADITVVPVQCVCDSKQPHNYVCPPNVSVSPLFQKKFSLLDKLCYALYAISCPAFWSETKRLLKNRELFFHRIKELIAFASRGERIAAALKKTYANILMNESSSIVLYSYWMTDAAYAIARVKSRYNCKAFARAHRGDLYEEERSFLKYLPMREYILSTLDGCYPISQDGSDYLVQKYGHKSKIAAIRLGSFDFGQRNFDKTMPPYRIVTCSYMSPVKRVPLIAKALSLITAYEIEWVHFGGGADYSKVEEVISRMPSNIHVALRGNTRHEDIMAYYKSTDVSLFVNVSTTEGIPVSIMEALSFGIPTLATNVGGTSELVVDGISGFLLGKDCSADELASKITTILEMEPSRYLDLRKSTRQYWMDHFNIVTNQRKFYDILLE